MKHTLRFLLPWILFTLVITIVFFFKTSQIITTVMILAGLIIGFILPLFIDAIIPKISGKKLEVDATLAKDVLTQGTSELVAGHFYSESQSGSLLRSYPLLGGFWVAAILVITSSTSMFGKGFILGLGLFLMIDLFLSREPATLKQRWFSTFKTGFTDQELHFFVWGNIAVFAVFSLLTLLI
ncbi:hypothetical protein KBD71_05205 [Candidatus Woesebacteria bacterium]|nr:hypothetical protein [Candidatus Woesebacteria bacterium]